VLNYFGICSFPSILVLSTLIFMQEQSNPYAVPISLGIFQILDSPLDITTTTIIRRIVSNHEAYQVCSDLVIFVWLVHTVGFSFTSLSFSRCHF
jgi:hypothetical protein